jgi:pimeloyl-ACP methyl ester carboxylesterase
MTNHHHWFSSGSYSLLGHLDMPDEQPPRWGVVIVPPFGWENICSYRPLRSLARSFASQGIAVLRFDLPGTGDSSGSALDSDLFAAWIRSVHDAVAELEALSGVQTVSVLGIRLGAMLALGAASTGAPIENLILWGASASGRAVLRELRAFRNMEVLEHAERDAPPAQPVPGFEVAGFLLNPETENSLRGFNPVTLPPLPNQSILLLSRDNFPHDGKLVECLERGGSRVTLNAGIGYQKMMAEPHEHFSFPPETEKALIDFLQTPMEAEKVISLSGREKVREERSCRLEGGIVENVYTHSYQDGSLFSIVATPAPRWPSSEWGLLFLNAGGVRHIGPNRMWVEASRRWAASGIPAIRLDFLRVGESGCEEPPSLESLHSDDLTDQLGMVMNEMKSKLNCRRFIAVGLCSGAYVAFQTLIRNSAIRSAILVNPRHFFWDPATDARRSAKRLGTGLIDLSDWRRLARGEFRPERVRQTARLALKRLLARRSGADRKHQIPAQALAEAWHQVRRFQTRVTLVFGEGEPLLGEMEDEKQLPAPTDPLIRCLRVGSVGHTFRALWAQQMLHDLIDREIGVTMGERLVCELSPRVPQNGFYSLDRIRGERPAS